MKPLQVEPWMSGTLNDVPPVIAALLYSFEHARIDLRRWTEDLTQEQLWRKTGEIAAVGFHIRHIAGSVDRLITYADGRTMSEEQMATLRSEQDPTGPDREQLLAYLEDTLRRAEQTARRLASADLSGIREIGRKRIPVPLGVLLVHAAEHTQRHVGEAIITTKIARL